MIINTIKADDFLNKKLPEREFIIYPFLPKQGLIMIYAKRGVGKTYFALLLANSIANGKSLFNEKWKILKKRKVLYIDGEMPANIMQERLKTMKIYGDDMNNISIITPDLQEKGMVPNLASEEGQGLLEKNVQESDVIIVDNLSTLARGVKENSADSWTLIQEWALRLRAVGKSIIFVHHAGKNDSQRGTSRKEDVLDTVINLKQPSDYKSEQGARFEIHFEKSRGFAGDEAKPFELRLVSVNNKLLWKKSDLGNDLEIDNILSLKDKGYSQRKISEELNMSLSKVNRLLKKNL